MVVTVNEDEQPELTIDNVTVAEGDAAEFTITLAPVWNRAVTVQWSTSDDGTDGASQATAGVDYTAQSTAATLTIAAGSTTATVSVQTTEDQLDEHEETFLVNLSGPTVAILGTASSGKGAITDADAAPTVSLGDATAVTEGNEPATTVDLEFPLTLDPVSGRDVTVTYTLGGTATANSDYTDPATKTVTIGAGSTTGNIVIPVKGDLVAEGNETVIVTLSGATNASVSGVSGEDTGTGTITDDDSAPTTAALSVSPSPVGEDDGATSVTVTATLAGSVTFPTDTTVRVTIGKDGDGAVSGTDYTGVSAFDLTISAEESSGEQTFTLTPTDDALDEDDEKLTVHATANGLTIADAEVTITDADDPPELTIADASAAEGEKAMFTVTLTPVSGRDVTVQWTTGDDGTDGAVQATADTDYTAQSAAATLTIDAGETSGTIEVQTTQDTLSEGSETFAVNLASPTNATLGTPKTATGTITDDDALPELTISDASVAEGGKAMFTVTLTPVSGRDVTVQWTTGDDGTDGAVQATADTDYTAQSEAATLTIAAGDTTGTIEVQTTEDALDEAEETFAVNLASPTNATLGAADSGIGTITDDDASPTVSLGDATAVTEGNEPATTVDLEFPLTLDPVSGRDVTVTYTLGGTATANSDYTDPDTKTATIGAGSTTGNIVIPVKGDLVAEGNETVIVTLSGATNASVSGVSGEDTGTGTITDDDTAPTTAALSVSPSSVGEDDGATSVTVTATLAGSVTFTADTTVRVTIGQDGDSAVSDTDYTGVSAFDLTISAEESSGEQSFTLAPTDDALDEGDEKLTVHATANGLTIADAEVTITDADDLPELTIADASAAEGEKAMFTVTLTPVSGRDVTVQWTTGDDSTDGAVQATSDTDYTAQSAAATLTIAAGDTSGTIEVQTTQDTLSEGSETFAVNLASPTNADLGTADSGIGTITDDDTAPTTAALSVSPSSVGEDDGATSVTVTATLAGSVTFTADTTVQVTVGQDGDSAVSGTDYTGVATFNLTITAGESSGQQTFTLTPTDDALDEDDEKLTVHATADGLTIADAEVTITDADPSPTVSLGDATAVIEGNDPATTVDLEFPLTLTPVIGRDVTVTYTLGGTATANSDYNDPATKTAIIGAGATTGNIVIPVKGDLVAEGDETVIVTLSGATNANVSGVSGEDTGTGTITDDDAGRGNNNNISVSIGSNGTVVEGDWLNFEITLSEPLTEAGQIPIDLEFVTADDYNCLQNNENKLCGSDLAPHKSMLGSEYAGILNHSDILRANKPWLVKVQAGDTSASGSIGTRKDGDGENERFRVVFDTAAAEWPNFDVQAGEAAFAEVIIVDEATYPVAARWWAGLSQQARERMVAGAGSGTSWENLLSQSVAKPFAKMRQENRAQAGALAGELVDAERSGADKLVKLSTPQAWWDSLDCRLRRVAVGEGLSADMDSLWCRDWPDGNAPGRLTQAQTSTVRDIFEAVVGTGVVGEPGQMSPQSSEPAAMLLTPVSNVQAVAADDASVTVTWDAVAQATSYTVEYTGTPSAPMNDLDASRVVVSGIENDIIGTTRTIRHSATESIAMTVTVTPAYVDGNGDTQLLNHLAGTATLEVVIVQPQPLQSECTLPSDTITVAEVTGWRDAFPNDADHVLRWNRVLAALGEDTGATPLTAAEAQTFKNQFNNDRWDRTTRTLEALEQCEGSTSADSQQTTPEISIASDGDITEGSAATFTITASPKPQAALPVSLTVSQSGDYGATTGSQTVTIPTSGTYTLPVATSDDSADEADGSITVTVGSGTGYTVLATASAAKVAVADDDVPEISIAAGGGVTEGGEATFTITASPEPHTALSVSVSLSQSGNYGVTTGSQTVTIPATGSYTLTVATSDDSTEEADGSVTATVNTGTGYTVSSTAGTATAAAVADDDDPPTTCNLPDDAITVAEVTGWRDDLGSPTPLRVSSAGTGYWPPLARIPALHR